MKGDYQTVMTVRRCTVPANLLRTGFLARNCQYQRTEQRRGLLDESWRRETDLFTASELERVIFNSCMASEGRDSQSRLPESHRFLFIFSFHCIKSELSKNSE